MKQRSKTLKFYLSDGTEVLFTSGQTILEALLENNIEINSVCGAMGTCGTCRVFIERGQELFPERNELELERAKDLNFVANERQSCQITAIPEITIRIPV